MALPVLNNTIKHLLVVYLVHLPVKYVLRFKFVPHATQDSLKKVTNVFLNARCQVFMLILQVRFAPYVILSVQPALEILVKNVILANKDFFYQEIPAMTLVLLKHLKIYKA